MAHSVSARKRVRQNAAHRARNRWRLRTMREAIKEFESKLSAGNKDEAQSALRNVCSVIDRTAQKGVIHKSQAARRKSRLTAKFKAAS
ncbi:MAG: 30S ribosomal protein S20 [Phycisphaerales bacterium]|nr:30S ribosomal protein S20 [Phycisphaerales bacterium]MCB9836172.1 30S ribosomal protein S20 [Phycisphaera sp.]